MERREKGKVLLRDTAALSTLAGIAVVLSFVTYGLFHSFAAHQHLLELRWRARGEAALAGGRPRLALDDLHSALAYAPDDRGLQIQLATALAATGRLQEAQVYFTTLLETEPGSGNINLQMARLAIQQKNTQAAIDHYQAAIDGTWNGDAFARRRDIRLELSRFLIAQGRFPEARSLLLITSGNGPDNYPLQLLLGSLLEQAGDPSDAMDVYRKAAQHRATRLVALEGEAHAASMLGRFAEERAYLTVAIEESGFAHQPEPARSALREQLAVTEHLLALYPAVTLPAPERARRIAYAAEQAQARLLSCPALVAAAPASILNGSGDGNASPAPAARSGTLLPAPLAARLEHLNPLASHSNDAGAAPPPETPPNPEPPPTLSTRWALLPTGTARTKRLATDPVFAQNLLELAYETERSAAKACSPATGDDALLLRIAETPNQVEGQP